MVAHCGFIFEYRYFEFILSAEETRDYELRDLIQELIFNLMKLLTSSCTRTFLTWWDHAIPFVQSYRQRIPRVAASLFLPNYNSRANKQTRDVSRPCHRNDIVTRLYLGHGYKAVKNLFNESLARWNMLSKQTGTKQEPQRPSYVIRRQISSIHSTLAMKKRTRSRPIHRAKDSLLRSTEWLELPGKLDR